MTPLLYCLWSKFLFLKVFQDHGLCFQGLTRIVAMVAALGREEMHVDIPNIEAGPLIMFGKKVGRSGTAPARISSVLSRGSPRNKHEGGAGGFILPPSKVGIHILAADMGVLFR